LPPGDAEILMRKKHALGSAALAVALIVSASLARAEAMTLVCQVESGEQIGSFTLRVDYDRKTVDFSRRTDGTVQHSAAATITEGAILWKAVLARTNEDTGDQWFEGSLDRLTGKGTVNFPKEMGFGFTMTGVYATCRRTNRGF
jgi:hypothetical protein